MSRQQSSARRAFNALQRAAHLRAMADRFKPIVNEAPAAQPLGADAKQHRSQASRAADAGRTDGKS